MLSKCGMRQSATQSTDTKFEVNIHKSCFNELAATYKQINYYIGFCDKNINCIK